MNRNEYISHLNNGIAVYQLPVRQVSINTDWAFFSYYMNHLNDSTVELPPFKSSLTPKGFILLSMNHLNAGETISAKSLQMNYLYSDNKKYCAVAYTDSMSHLNSGG